MSDIFCLYISSRMFYFVFVFWNILICLHANNSMKTLIPLSCLYSMKQTVYPGLSKVKDLPASTTKARFVLMLYVFLLSLTETSREVVKKPRIHKILRTLQLLYRIQNEKLRVLSEDKLNPCLLQFVFQDSQWLKPCFVSCACRAELLRHVEEQLTAHCRQDGTESVSCILCAVLLVLCTEGAH